MAAGEPLEVPDDELGGLSVADIVRGLGYVYAATSYRDNGLVAADAVTDLEQLGELVQAAHPALAAAPAYLVGVSEGGLATALAMQNPSSPFAGGLALCGPVGSFQGQSNYFGDFRLIFDYFFPGVLPGSPFDPADLLALQSGWESTWEPAIRVAIASDVAAGAQRTQQLLLVTRASYDSVNLGQTVADVLWYEVFATPDALLKLGGLVFDNTTRSYVGSQNDVQLNAEIPRFALSADPADIARYETTGRIERPTVTLHTTGDQIVPYFNEYFYALKAFGEGDLAQLTPFSAARYGHCQFTLPEVLTAFAVLAWRVGSQQLVVSSDLFPSTTEESEFLRMARARGTRPSIQTVRLR